MNQRTVVVHGASGAQGSAIARRLGGRGWAVVGLARDTTRLPDHLAAARADLRDLESLVAAYQDADAVVVQLPLEFDAAAIAAHVDNVLHALRRSAVGRVVFNANSPLPADEIGIPFVDGRVRLARDLPDAAASASVVGPAFAYMENLAIPSAARRIREDGELAYPLPADFPMPWLAADDLADVVADLLDAPEPPDLRVVAGPEALTGPAAARALSDALGRDVTWVSIDHTEYEASLTPHLGAAAAAGIASFYAAPPAFGEGPTPSDSLVHGPTTLLRWARADLRPAASAHH